MSASFSKTSAGAGADDTPALEAVAISKHFSGVAALSDLDFSCRAGEVHVLLGANGAGKSTLVKIISGVQPADAGTISVAGKEVELQTPAQAASAGIAAVFQELSLCPQLTVAENIMLAREPTTALWQISSRRLYDSVETLFKRLGINHISPKTLVVQLTLADRQLVEIAKALSHNPEILIFDEGTSSLGPDEVHRLFGLIGQLRHEGKSIIFISHRMAEVREIADRITVFRNGTNVGTFAAASVNDDELVKLMLGRQVQQSFPERVGLPVDASAVLKVDGLSAGEFLHDISFTAHAGEVLGIAGLEGQGQGALLLALFGILRRTTGQVSVHGKHVRLGTPWRATRAGFALIPEDRKTQGLLQPLSVRENIILASLDRISRLGWVDRHRERTITQASVQRMEIKTASLELPVRTLSGGNQQKVVVAKWLAAGGEIFMFYDPTRGVDVGTKSSFYVLISELAKAGKVVLLYTTELSEFVGLCHRVLIMDDRRIVQQLDGASASENDILAASIGTAGSSYP